MFLLYAHGERLRNRTVSELQDEVQHTAITTSENVVQRREVS